MAVIQRSKFCKNCGKHTLHQFNTFSGGMGCLLTILTGGLFLVFLIPYKLLIEPFRNIYRCQQCGKGKLLSIALALACSAATADEIAITRHAAKLGYTGKSILGVTVSSIKDGVVSFDRTPQPDDQPINFSPRGNAGTFSGFGVGGLGASYKGPQIPMTAVTEITLDDIDNWLTITLKNGDVIRGEGESITPKTVRLKGREKPIRMLDVREIIATEAPPPEAAE